jgi:peroxiredoxin
MINFENKNMALTLTTPFPLGFKAPDFLLTETRTGKNLSLQEVKGDKATVVMFISNHCPYVKHVIDELVQLGIDYKDKGIGFIAISSNDPLKYPEDAPEKMRELAEKLNFPFPYFFDESQEVAKKYQAACTPDFNVFDKDLKCVYRGQLDDSRPGNEIAVSGKDLRLTLDSILLGKTISTNQKPSIGCSIKWR